MSHYTVDRKTWLRGEGSHKSYLLRACDGKMCCLGHVALQCGFTSEEITAVDCPGALRSPAAMEKWPAWFFNSIGNQANEMTDAMATNDEQDLPEGERERRIAEIFAEHGDVLEFVG